jgi:phage-related protein
MIGPPADRPPQHRWRNYKAASGGDPVKRFIENLTEAEVIELAAAMKDVETRGLEAARHLRGDIYEVRASSNRRTLRLLFAAEGRRIFLALEGFAKKTQKTPPGKIKLAESRLRDWRGRAAR